MKTSFYLIDLPFRLVLIRFSRSSESQCSALENPLKNLRKRYDFMRPVRARHAQNACHFARFLKGFARFRMHANNAKPWKRNERLWVFGMPFGPRGPEGSQKSPISIGFIRFLQRCRDQRAGRPEYLIWTSYYKRFFKAALAWIVVPENINLDKLL